MTTPSTGSDWNTVSGTSPVPDCGKEIKIFGESHIEETAAELGIPVLGKMPIDTELAKAVEEERFYEVQNQYLDEDKIIPCFESTGK